MKTLRFAVACVAAIAFATSASAQVPFNFAAARDMLNNMHSSEAVASQPATPAPSFTPPPETVIQMGNHPDYVSVYKRAKCGSVYDASKMGADQESWRLLCVNTDAYKNDGSLTNYACNGVLQTNGTQRAREFAERQAGQCQTIMDREAALEAKFGPVISKAQRLVVLKSATANGQPTLGRGAVSRF